MRNPRTRREVSVCQWLTVLWKHHEAATRSLRGPGGKAEEGVKHYEEALRIRPGFPEAHVDLGLLLLESPRPDPSRVNEAARHFVEALRLAPRNQRASAGLARALDLSRGFQGGARGPD